jgi:hypothetical protein
VLLPGIHSHQGRCRVTHPWSVIRSRLLSAEGLDAALRYVGALGRVAALSR